MKRYFIYELLLFLLIFNITLATSSNNRFIEEGREFKPWSSESLGVDDYLRKAGIDMSIFNNKKYLIEDNKDSFYLEFEGDFKNLKLLEQNCIKDKTTIKDEEFNLRYRPSYNSIAVAYNENKVIISKNLQDIVLKLNNHVNIHKEIDGYFNADKDYFKRRVDFYSEDTIYGRSFARSIEENEKKIDERIYLKGFVIDKTIKKQDILGRTRVILGYDGLSKGLLNGIEEIKLTPERLRSILGDDMIASFYIDGGVLIENNSRLAIKEIKSLYDEGVLSRIGIKNGSKKDIAYISIPFYDVNKYVYSVGNYLFITNNFDYIKKIEKADKNDNKKLIGELDNLSRFKEEVSGYTGNKKRI